MKGRSALSPFAAVLVAIAISVCGASTRAHAQGESSRKDPSLGYAYPSGGGVGTLVQVLVGGQNLRGATGARVSGAGVKATVVRYVRPLSPQEMQELLRQIREVSQLRRSGGKAADKPAAPDEDRVELPDHPLLRDLGGKSEQQLRAIADRFISLGARKQMNVQLAETVEIEVTIARDAAVGDRELRVMTPQGLTHPVRFQVGALPEVREEELVEADAGDAAPLVLPLLVNGQIRPGDIDRFRIQAKRGQRVVIDASARRLIPYLADAVPGWFQATAALRDGLGREIAFGDDYRGEPDPVVFAKIPADGVYVLEIRDALYRGREDFVYRVIVGEEPFVTSVFPLGGRSGSPTNASVGGWNLSGGSLPLDTQAGAEGTRWTSMRHGRWTSNPIPYEVDDLPECMESEAGNDPPVAQAIELPVIVNGRIATCGDVDAFTFEGRAGDEVVAEVVARRLGSPVDSLVSLTDGAGGVIAWNDDHADAASGLITHQADSYLRARLPADGAYQVRVADAQRHAGPEYAYRLRVGPPRPGFTVFLTPSSLNMNAGRSVPVRAHVVRRDGFDGGIELALSGAPVGLRLDGASIPAGCDTLPMTLTAVDILGEEPLVLGLEARAQIGAAEFVRPVVPADERMQAFIYQHLVSAQELMIAVKGKPRAPIALDLAGAMRVEVPLGGTATVRILAQGRAIPGDLLLELLEPPAGVTIESLRVQRGGRVSFALRADAETAKAGSAGNLIVELAAMNGERRASLGWLPAIPYAITARVQ